MTNAKNLSPEQVEWNIQKVKLRKMYTTLTDEDVTFQPGKKDVMMNNLQIILGKTKNDLLELIASL